MLIDFSAERPSVFNNLRSIDENILSKNDSNILKVLPFCDHSLIRMKNTFILVGKIEYINSKKRFDAPLHQNTH